MTLASFKRLIIGTALAGTDNGDDTITIAVAAGGIGTTQLADTAVTPSTYGDGTHVGQFTVDADGRITAAVAVAITGVGGLGSDGWVDDSANTWTYASASTFTVSGDRTAVFGKGTRLRFTQTTVKYGVVASSSVAGGETTVTIIVNTDYVLANAAISVNSFSHMMGPEGYPKWFNYAVTAAGFTGALSTALAKFQILDGWCFIHVLIDGTSNATTFTWTLPVASAQGILLPVYVTNNSLTRTTPGRAFPASSSTTVTMGLDMSADGGFTASNGKGMYATFGYPF